MENQNQPPRNQTAQAQQIPQDEINKMNEDKAGFVTLQKIRDLLQYLYTAFVKYPMQTVRQTAERRKPYLQRAATYKGESEHETV